VTTKGFKECGVFVLSEQSARCVLVVNNL